MEDAASMPLVKQRTAAIIADVMITLRVYTPISEVLLKLKDLRKNIIRRKETLSDEMNEKKTMIAFWVPGSAVISPLLICCSPAVLMLLRLVRREV